MVDLHFNGAEELFILVHRAEELLELVGIVGQGVRLGLDRTSPSVLSVSATFSGTAVSFRANRTRGVADSPATRRALSIRPIDPASLVAQKQRSPGDRSPGLSLIPMRRNRARGIVLSSPRRASR